MLLAGLLLGGVGAVAAAALAWRSLKRALPLPPALFHTAR
jgi:hypothetical protein